MVVLVEAIGADVPGGRLLARRSYVERVLGAGKTDVDDSSPLADGKCHRRRARRGCHEPRMLFAAPVLDHESRAVRIEKETLGVARPWRAQVDQEHDRKFETF